MMHTISAAMGAQYHVFLQPTTGLKGIQSRAPKGSKDEQSVKRVLTNKSYIENLNNFYEGARSFCKKVTYCHDISNLVPPSGNVYANPRHHNAEGNSKIAKLIYDTLQID